MLVLCADRFGQEVAHSMASAHAVDVRPMPEFAAALQGRPAVTDDLQPVIVAASRPWPRLFQQIGAAITGVRARGTFVYIDGAALVIGPTHDAGRGCWRCFARRELMHLGADVPPDSELARRQFLDMNPDYENLAWLSHVAQLAGSMALRILGPASVRSGLVWKLNLLSGLASEACIVGLHGCSCRDADAPRARFVDALRTLLPGS